MYFILFHDINRCYMLAKKRFKKKKNVNTLFCAMKVLWKHLKQIFFFKKYIIFYFTIYTHTYEHHELLLIKKNVEYSYFRNSNIVYLTPSKNK